MPICYEGCLMIANTWTYISLYVHLREQIVKRIHHGLSGTILVNTLTDVREFKNINVSSGNTLGCIVAHTLPPLNGACSLPL